MGSCEDEECKANSSGVTSTLSDTPPHDLGEEVGSLGNLAPSGEQVSNDEVRVALDFDNMMSPPGGQPPGHQFRGPNAVVATPGDTRWGSRPDIAIALGEGGPCAPDGGFSAVT